MFGFIPLLALAVLVAIFAGFYLWARRQGLVSRAAAAGGPEPKRHISVLTEAVGYIGAILILAGGAAAIGQRWDSLGAWGHVAVYAGAAILFLLVGIGVRGIREPAIQRLVGVSWFLSALGVAGAAGFLAQDVLGSGSSVLLAAGLAVTGYGGILWLIRRAALQNFALFGGLVATIAGIIVAVSSSPPPLAFAASLWAFGLAWAWLGWRRYIEPIWVTLPCGVILALLAPSFGAGDYGWLYVIGIVTAAAAMAASVPLQNTPLLAAGTLAMFGYVTGAAVTYLHRSLGVPAALALTGVLVIGLAVVSARLMRATRPPKPGEPGQPGETGEPGRPGQDQEPPRRAA